MPDAVELSASLGAMTNLIHGFIYFAPEASSAYTELGLDAEQHYFASRAAPLGPVPAEVVVATFHNFNPDIVRSAIPAAWAVADPAAIQTARMQAASAVLRRCLSSIDAADLAEATGLAGSMIDGVGIEGKPLAAANRAVPEPSDPWARFWQRITVLREWRGDVHVAVLTAAPLDGVEALILHAATDQVPREALVATRRWPDDAWAAAVARLVARGLVDADERFTASGREYRDEIERRTNVASLALVEAVGEAGTHRLIELLKPIRRGLLDGGAFARMGR